GGNLLRNKVGKKERERDDERKRRHVGALSPKAASSEPENPAVRVIILLLMLDVLEFLCHEKARNLRAGALLPDEVHVLQFSHGSGVRKRFAPYAEAVCEEINHHRQWLNAAGVGGPGRLGRSSA